MNLFNVVNRLSRIVASPLTLTKDAIRIISYKRRYWGRHKLSYLDEIKEYCDFDYFETHGTPGASGSEDFYREYARYLSTAIPLAGKTVLELGAAKGGLVQAIMEMGGDAWGVEFSKWATENCFMGARGRLVCNSAHDLSAFPHNKFDIVVSAEVFEHIPKQYIPDMVKEIMRVTKDNAIIYFTTVTSSYEDQPRGPEDPDLSHINLQPRWWWEKQFMELYPVKKREDLFEILSKQDLYQQYKWHTYVFDKYHAL